MPKVCVYTPHTGPQNTWYKNQSDATNVRGMGTWPENANKQGTLAHTVAMSTGVQHVATRTRSIAPHAAKMDTHQWTEYAQSSKQGSRNSTTDDTTAQRHTNQQAWHNLQLDPTPAERHPQAIVMKACHHLSPLNEHKHIIEWAKL